MANQWHTAIVLVADVIDSHRPGIPNAPSLATKVILKLKKAGFLRNDIHGDLQATIEAHLTDD